MTSETDQSADLTIAKDRVVRFHYTIRNSDGEVVETTRESEPLAMLQGHGNVLAGIETALDGHCAFCIGKQFATLPSPSWDVIAAIVPETLPVAWNGINIDVADIGERFPQARPRAPPSSDSDPA